MATFYVKRYGVVGGNNWQQGTTVDNDNLDNALLPTQAADTTNDVVPDDVVTYTNADGTHGSMKVKMVRGVYYQGSTVAQRSETHSARQMPREGAIGFMHRYKPNVQVNHTMRTVVAQRHSAGGSSPQISLRVTGNYYRIESKHINGTYQKQIGALPYDTWTKFVILYNLAPDSTGYIHTYMNGELVDSYSGPTNSEAIAETAGNWKWGMYSAPLKACHDAGTCQVDYGVPDTLTSWEAWYALVRVATKSTGTLGELYRMADPDLKDANVTSYPDGSAPLSATAEGNVALWAFEEADTSTSVLDGSGNANDGTIQRSTGFTRPAGIIGKGLRLEGTLQRYAKLTKSTSLTVSDKLSIAVHVKPERATGDKLISTLVTDTISGLNGYSLHINTDAKAVFSIGTGGIISPDPVLISTAPIDVTGTVWTHLAVTFDGTVMKTYINGNLDTSQTIASASIGNDYTEVFIGAAPDESYRYLGTMDELRVYNKTLGVEEIRKLIPSYPKVKVKLPGGFTGATTKVKSGGVFVSANTKTKKGGAF